MKLHVDTLFQRVTLERFVDIYFSEELNNSVAKVSGLKSRTLVDEKRQSDGSRDRRVRLEPGVTLPGPIQKLADGFVGGKAHLTYDEVSSYDATTHTSKFFIDSKLKDRATFEGTIRFVVEGDGVRRVIDGVIELRAPLVGGMIERYIESETQKGYVKIAKFLQEWIDTHP